jgi:hypothetical protein
VNDAFSAQVIRMTLVVGVIREEGQDEPLS